MIINAILFIFSIGLGFLLWYMILGRPESKPGPIDGVLHIKETEDKTTWTFEMYINHEEAKDKETLILKVENEE